MSYLLKFIKEDLVWAEPKFTKFHKPFLAKNALLSAWEILGFARFLVGFCHLVLLCRSCKRYEKFFQNHSQSACCKAPHLQAATHRQEQLYAIKQKHPQQKLSILLLKPRHFTICRHIGSFDKISIKSSKKVICSPL